MSPPSKSARSSAERASCSGSSNLCSMPSCSKPQRYGQRYCKQCHSNYMKAWRAKRRRQERDLRATVVKLRSKVVLQNEELAELKASG